MEECAAHVSHGKLMVVSVRNSHPSYHHHVCHHQHDAADDGREVVLLREALGVYIDEGARDYSH